MERYEETQAATNKAIREGEMTVEEAMDCTANDFEVE